MEQVSVRLNLKAVEQQGHDGYSKIEAYGRMQKKLVGNRRTETTASVRINPPFCFLFSFFFMTFTLQLNT